VASRMGFAMTKLPLANVVDGLAAEEEHRLFHSIGAPVGG